MDTKNSMYGRGQLLVAIWRMFIRPNEPFDDPRKIPDRFIARVRKAWQFGVPIPEDERPGTGNAISYTAYHAFELTLLLNLVSLGFNQAEAADFVIQRRAGLKRRHGMITAQTSPFYMTFAFVEINEGQPLFNSPGSPRILKFMDYHENYEDLCSYRTKNARAEGWVTIEIGEMARRVARYLEEAPEIKKGRPG